MAKDMVRICLCGEPISFMLLLGVFSAGRIEYAQEVGVYSGILKMGLEMTASEEYVVLLRSVFA